MEPPRFPHESDVLAWANFFFSVSYSEMWCVCGKGKGVVDVSMNESEEECFVSFPYLIT